MLGSENESRQKDDHGIYVMSSFTGYEPSRAERTANKLYKRTTHDAREGASRRGPARACGADEIYTTSPWLCRGIYLYVELWIARLGWKGSVARRPRPRGWWREDEGPQRSRTRAARQFGDSSRFISGPFLDCATTRLILSNAVVAKHSFNLHFTRNDLIFSPPQFRYICTLAIRMGFNIFSINHVLKKKKRKIVIVNVSAAAWLRIDVSEVNFKCKSVFAMWDTRTRAKVNKGEKAS